MKPLLASSRDGEGGVGTRYDLAVCRDEHLCDALATSRVDEARIDLQPLSEFGPTEEVHHLEQMVLRQSERISALEERLETAQRMMTTRLLREIRMPKDEAA